MTPRNVYFPPTTSQRQKLLFKIWKQDGQQIPCQASGQGGNLEIICEVPTAGKLVVQENTISDWKAWRDQVQAPLLPTKQWLSVDAPAGRHTYSFRYSPWDVPLRAAISLASFGVWLWLWFNRPKQSE